MKKGIQNIIKDFFVSGYFLLVIGLVIVVGIGMINKSGALDEGEVEIITKSNLMEAIDVSELATSEFIYNGIAEVYNDKKAEKVDYYIRYDARVRAGIDIKNVDFNIMKEENIIEVTLPEVEIFTPPSIDPDSLSYIPSEKEYDLNINAVKLDNYKLDIHAKDTVKYVETVYQTINKPKKNHFTLGLSVGYGYGIKSKDIQPFVGITATYNILGK